MSFEYYANRGGVIWYKCSLCHYKTRGKPDVCPVCHNKAAEQAAQAEQGINTGKAFDAALEKIKAVMEKYGGGEK